MLPLTLQKRVDYALVAALMPFVEGVHGCATVTDSLLLAGKCLLAAVIVDRAFIDQSLTNDPRLAVTPPAPVPVPFPAPTTTAEPPAH